MKFRQNILLSLLLILAQSNFGQVRQINYAAWQHPILQAIEKNNSTYITFHHKTDNDYFVPLAILNKRSFNFYYVNTFGQIFDSISVGPKMFQQLVAKNIDPFVLFSKYTTIETLNEIQEIKSLVRKQGNNVKLPSPKDTYLNYSKLSSTNSSLEKIILLDDYEKLVWQQYILMNLIVKEPTDPEFSQKANSWKNYKPAKLMQHQTHPQDYAEYTNSNRFSSLSKAILYPSKSTIYLYNQKDIIVDSFKIKKDKSNQLTAEKVDVFALYRVWLEWQLESTNEQLIAIANENIKAAISNSSNTIQLQNLIALQKYSQFLQQKITYAVIPDQDLLLINILEQRKIMQRKKWVNAKGWEILNPPPPNPTQGSAQTFTKGNKEYFLTDHRGNILATVSDRKIQHCSDGITVDYYTADIVTATDYAPFGSQLPGRTYRNNGQQLKYGYNGKENDNEIKGEGNSIDFEARIDDPRLGRFLSIDRLSKKFPSESNYSFAGNNPILYVDIDGEYKYPKNKASEYTKKYPMLTKYLSTQVQKDVLKSPTIMAGMLKYSGGNLTEKAITDATTWKNQSSPTIKIVGDKELYGANGRYLSESNTILINEKLATQLEKASPNDKQAALYGLYVTLTHETVHYGDYLDRFQTEGEVGGDYANDVFYSKTITVDGVTFPASNFGGDHTKIEDAKKMIEKNKTEDNKADVVPTVPAEDAPKKEVNNKKTPVKATNNQKTTPKKKD